MDRNKPYPYDFRSEALSVGSDVVNDSPFRALSQWWCFFNKKMDINLTLDFCWEPCQLVLMWLMTLPSEPCHSGGVFNKKDRHKPNPIPDFTGLAYISGFLLGLKSHGLISHDYLSQST